MIRAVRAVGGALLCLSVACSGDGDGGSAEKDPLRGGSGSAGRVVTDCGVMENGNLQNPIALKNATAVKIERVIGTNLIEVSVPMEEGKDIWVVKLHGIGASDQSTAVKNLLRGFVGTDAFFVSAGCFSKIRGGSEVAVGQILTPSGESISELLIKSGLARKLEKSGSCGEEEIAVCYAALEDSGESTNGVSNFLWKPESESPYNPGGLSILTNPCNAKVFVDGVELRNYGPSNGRCITARAAGSGCSFGQDIKVEVIDRDTGEPLTFNGAPHIMIPNGCERVEFAGSTAVKILPPPPACMPATDEIRYIPASSSCGGNIAVELSGSLQDAFSVQLRLPDGSDRLDPACAEQSCTPYKVNKYINTADTKTACFGAPGDSPLMSEIIQVSVKLFGTDSNPQRFCISDPSRPIN